MESENQVNSVTPDPQLLEAVRKQVEYYFSKENLQSDVYLTSQMDAQMSVSINVIMKFAKLKALTQDESIVRKALEESNVVSVLDNKIKANIKSNTRSTIILREIPSDAPREEVEEIFKYDGSKPIKEIRSEIGDTWFITMETEEAAKDTLLDLRIKKRTFRGQPIKARIKTEAVVRSYYPVPSVNPIPVPAGFLPYPPIPGMEMMPPYGFMQPPIEIPSVTVPQSSVSNEVETSPSIEDSNGDSANNKNQTANRNKDKKGLSRTSTATSSSGAATNSSSNNSDPRKKNLSDKKPSSKDSRDKRPTETKPPIEINATTFPPLLSGQEDNTPIPTPGYKDTFIKLSFDEIINIVKNVKEAVLPADFNPEQHSYAMTATPNLDLLKRQRTFSIDETREQLRQGRPVQREAILPGAVDYNSMMYGDESNAKQNKPKQVEAPVAEVIKPEEPLNIVPTTSATQKISTSTWAAMVKSAAELSVSTPAIATPVVAKASNSTPAKAQAPSAEVKKASAPAKTEKSEKKGSKSEKQNKKSGKEEKEKKVSEPSSEDSTSPVNEQQSEDSAPQTSTSAWGGKASFANILKQNASVVVEEPKKVVVAPATSSTDNSTKKSSGRNGRTNGSRRNNSGHGSNSDGPWVKETLPALNSEK